MSVERSARSVRRVSPGTARVLAKRGGRVMSARGAVFDRAFLQALPECSRSRVEVAS